MKEKKWYVTADGAQHEIVYKRRKLFVDGMRYEVKNMNLFAVMVDCDLEFSDVQCRFVALGNKADVSVNGIFLDSKEEYVPLARVPKWVTALEILSVIYGFLLNSWLVAALGAAFGVWYVNVWIKKQKADSVILAFLLASVAQTIIAIFVYIVLVGMWG